MIEWRIKKHPIPSIPNRKKIALYWNNQKLQAYEGEMISIKGDALKKIK